MLSILAQTIFFFVQLIRSNGIPLLSRTLIVPPLPVNKSWFGGSNFHLWSLTLEEKSKMFQESFEKTINYATLFGGRSVKPNSEQTKHQSIDQTKNQNMNQAKQIIDDDDDGHFFEEFTREGRMSFDVKISFSPN